MKLSKQQETVLTLLQLAGSEGVTNIELNSRMMRFGGRLHELRRKGFCISTHHVGGSLYRFVLIHNEPYPMAGTVRTITGRQQKLFQEAP